MPIPNVNYCELTGEFSIKKALNSEKSALLIPVKKVIKNNTYQTQQGE